MSGQADGGQAQGGQGSQPQSGQPQGQQYQQGTQQDVLQEWGIYGTVLFALAGFGTGLFFFLVDALDEPLLEASGGGGLGQQIGSSFGQIFLLFTPWMAVFIAAFVGAAISRQGSFDDSMGFKVAGVSMGAGTVLAFILSAFLISTTVDGASIAFGGLIINSVLAGIVAAAIGAGGVWADRNQAPN